MNPANPVLEQLRQMLSQSPEGGAWSVAWPAASAVLLIGIAMSALGAKFARLGITLSFLLLGGWGGYEFGRAAGVAPLLVSAVGAGMIGLIGHLTFRVWVGVLTAAVLSACATGVFGYYRVTPHMLAFERERFAALSSDVGSEAASIRDSTDVARNRFPSAKEWLDGAANYVTARDARAVSQARLLSIAVGVTGLLLGLVAARWMLILSTSLLGTFCVSSGITALLASFLPSSREAMVNHPGVYAIGVGGFLAASLIVQTLLTRKAPAPPAA
jgi:hypothetical protein